MLLTLNTSASRFLTTTLWIILLPIILGQQTNDFASSMQMLQLVNNVRLQNNIRPLCLSEKLVRAATAHSAYQASINRMTHDGPVSLGDRFVKQGYQPSAVAENVGFTSTPFIQVVFDIWMSSSEHRANILDPNYVHFGTASSIGSNNMYFWTQLFAKPMNLILEPCGFSAAANAARLNPGQAGFNPNGSWGGSGSSNFKSNNPGIKPDGNCIYVDNGFGGKSLKCNLAGPNLNGYGPKSSPNNPNSSYSINNQYNPINSNNPYPQNWNNLKNSNMPINNNLYNPSYGSNQINNPAGSNIVNNPSGYDGTSCTIISTSPAPDGQGSISVLRCASNPAGTNNLGDNSQQLNSGLAGNNNIDNLNPVNINPLVNAGNTPINPMINDRININTPGNNNPFVYNLPGNNPPANTWSN